MFDRIGEKSVGRIREEIGWGYSLSVEDLLFICSERVRLMQEGVILTRGFYLKKDLAFVKTEKIKLFAVVGPTASGKSAFAVALARACNGEIVSCDSMQIYKRMNIGTAKPTLEEQGGVPHHLIDCVEPEIPFSCADYVKMAKEVVSDIVSRGKMPVFCGGTGLYLDSFLRGNDFEEMQTDPALRAELFAYAEQQGTSALHARLAAIDPIAAAAIHENNVKRVIRAMEVYACTGKTKTEMDLCSQSQPSPYDATVIGLRFSDRSDLYERIDSRVEQMLKNGLLEETERLMKDGVFEKNGTAAQAIGYKELLGYFRGEESLSNATEQLKRATRRYAKRQMTWFDSKPYVHWLERAQDGSVRSEESLLLEAEQRGLIRSVPGT